MSKAHHKGATAPEAAPAASIETEAAPAAEVVLEAPVDDQLRADMQAEMRRLELAFEERLAEVMDAVEQRLFFNRSAALDRIDAVQEKVSGEVQSIKASLARVVDALGRQDLLTPQASAEQLEAALAKGQCRVKVLADYSTLKFTVKAGRVLDSQSSDHRALLDGVRSGRLKVSLLPPE